MFGFTASILSWVAKNSMVRTTITNEMIEYDSLASMLEDTD